MFPAPSGPRFFDRVSVGPVTGTCGVGLQSVTCWGSSLTQSLRKGAMELVRCPVTTKVEWSPVTGVNGPFCGTYLFAKCASLQYILSQVGSIQ